MKAKLEFELPEEREEFRDAVAGTSYKIAFGEVWDKVFRPFHKHGYNDPTINSILERIGDDAYVLMEKLGELYNECRPDQDDLV